MPHRRPADVFLPSLKGGLVALDVAVVALQRQRSASSYSRAKESHLDTARLCKEQGVKFQPMVCEATGAWSQEARAILRNISQAAAARLEEDAGSLHTQLLQELSVIRTEREPFSADALK